MQHYTLDNVLCGPHTTAYLCPCWKVPRLYCTRHHPNWVKQSLQQRMTHIKLDKNNNTTNHTHSHIFHPFQNKHKQQQQTLLSYCFLFALLDFILLGNNRRYVCLFLHVQFSKVKPALCFSRISC